MNYLNNDILTIWYSNILQLSQLAHQIIFNVRTKHSIVILNLKR